jgi:hypothetical protein
MSWECTKITRRRWERSVRSQKNDRNGAQLLLVFFSSPPVAVPSIQHHVSQRIHVISELLRVRHPVFKLLPPLVRAIQLGLPTPDLAQTPLIPGLTID